MKNTFNGWLEVDKLDINETVDLILTGRTAAQAIPDQWIFPYIGGKDEDLNVLDFGCGVGRNTFGMKEYAPMWSITGYDNENMLNKIQEFHCIHYYNKPIYKDITFSPEWNNLKSCRFNTIFCCLVLQHIYKNTLQSYIKDFKNMTNKLIVFGRRFNDDGGTETSTWSILEDNGLVPYQFYSGTKEISYSNGKGDPH